MTARALCTQSQIQRALKAALKAGLRVKGIAPDGTILIDSEEEGVPVAPVLPDDEKHFADDDND